VRLGSHAPVNEVGGGEIAHHSCCIERMGIEVGGFCTMVRESKGCLDELPTYAAGPRSRNLVAQITIEPLVNRQRLKFFKFAVPNDSDDSFPGQKIERDD
jgi:hypothetical protein